MSSRNQRRKKRNAKQNVQAQAHKKQRVQQGPGAGGSVDAGASRGTQADHAHPHRSSTETKASYRTTELIAYVAAVLAVIITALALDGDGQGGADPFGAETALQYIALLTVGYLVSRGLAKAGSHHTRINGDDIDDVNGFDGAGIEGDLDHGDDIDHRDDLDRDGDRRDGTLDEERVEERIQHRIEERIEERLDEYIDERVDDRVKERTDPETGPTVRS